MPTPFLHTHIKGTFIFSSSLVMELPSNDVTSQCVFGSRDVGDLSTSNTSMLMTRLRLRDSFASKMNRLKWIVYILIACVCVQYFIITYITSLYHRNDRLDTTRPLGFNTLVVEKLSRLHALVVPTNAPSNDMEEKNISRNITIIPSNDIRVACLIPYIGSALPSWFDTFVSTAYSSADLFDFLIFVTKAPIRHVPPNVKMIHMDESELHRRIVRLDVHPHTGNPPFPSLLTSQTYVPTPLSSLYHTYILSHIFIPVQKNTRYGFKKY